MKLSKYLINKKANLLTICLGLIIAWIVGISADLHVSAGLGGFFPIITPFIIALFTLLIYFGIKKTNEKTRGIISILGAIINIYYAVEFYISNG